MRTTAIAVAVGVNVCVADGGNPQVQKFDSQGQFLMKRGGAGDGEGHTICMTLRGGFCRSSPLIPWEHAVSQCDETAAAANGEYPEAG